jgi:hypothetical protein
MKKSPAWTNRAFFNQQTILTYEVARLGFEPKSFAYETNMLPLQHPAIP